MGTDKKVVATKNLNEQVHWGMEGIVVSRYEHDSHRYVVVRFENGERMTFGDPAHPLISMKNCVKLKE